LKKTFFLTKTKNFCERKIYVTNNSRCSIASAICCKRAFSEILLLFVNTLAKLVL